MNCAFCTEPLQPWQGYGCSRCAPGVGYLCQSCGGGLATESLLAAAGHGSDKEIRMMRLMSMEHAWDLLKHRENPTQAEILDLGRRHGCTSGKWMFFPGTRTVDAAWSALARVCINAPENLTDTAKVATGVDGRPARVICIYVEDFDDNDAKEELGNLVVGALKEIYQKGSISFKPDVFTHLEINSNNQSKLKPTLHIKRWGPEGEVQGTTSRKGTTRKKKSDK